MGLGGRVIGAVLRQTGVLGILQEAWRRDLERASAKMRRDTERRVERLQESVKELGVAVRASRGRAQLLERRVEAADIDSRQSHLLAGFTSGMNTADVCGHVARAVSAAPLDPAPCAHLVIDEVFPPDFYQLLVESLPAPEFFLSRDPIKMNLRPARFKIVPALTRAVWEFVDADVTRTIADVALRRLQPYLHARCEAMFGAGRADAALAIPHRAFGGRIMLRRPGYLQRPHLDPKRSSATVLIYVARPGDPEGVGTALFALSSPVLPVRTSTYYPEDHGVTCTPVKRVPFRPNTAVVFVNAEGAHGAEIPKASAAESFQRYAFMYYIGPDLPELLRFVATLPTAAQQGWLGLAESGDE